MKRTIISISLALLSLTAVADDIMTKNSDGTYVINTEELCKARGYKGMTPLEISIKGNKITAIKPARNRETPKYFNIVKTKILPQFIGKKVSKAATMAKDADVDGMTGATISSKAVLQNIKAAMDYYKENK